MFGPRFSSSDFSRRCVSVYSSSSFVIMKLLETVRAKSDCPLILLQCVAFTERGVARGGVSDIYVDKLSLIVATFFLRIQKTGERSVWFKSKQFFLQQHKAPVLVNL